MKLKPFLTRRQAETVHRNALRVLSEIGIKVEHEEVIKGLEPKIRALQERLEQFKELTSVGDLRQCGLIAGIELVKNRETKEPASEETSKIVKECLRNGLLIAGAGIHHNVIRMLLPLVITDEQLDEGLDVLENAVAMVDEGR